MDGPPKCSGLGVRPGKPRRRHQIRISGWPFWLMLPSLTPSKIYKCWPILFIQNAPGRYFTVELELFYGFLVYHHRFRRRKLKTSKKACFWPPKVNKFPNVVPIDLGLHNFDRKCVFAQNFDPKIGNLTFLKITPSSTALTPMTKACNFYSRICSPINGPPWQFSPKSISDPVSIRPDPHGNFPKNQLATRIVYFGHESSMVIGFCGFCCCVT